MRRLLGSSLLLRLRRSISLVELAAVLSAALLVELAYANNPNATDVLDIAFVMGLGAAALMAATLSRYRDLPLTSRLLDAGAALVTGLRERLVLSLGLDFHPERHPRLPAFTGLRRAILVAALAAMVLYPARGLVREVLLLTRVPGLHSVHVVLLGVTWLALLAGLAVQVPAIVLGAIEVLKRRAGLRGVARALCIAAFLVVVAVLAAVLDEAVGIEGCLSVLAFAALLPSVVRAVDPPGGPWLNVAIGKRGEPKTAPLGDLIRDAHRLFALEAFLVVCALAPSPDAVGPDVLPVSSLLLRLYGWSAAWLFTGGALLAIGEFNRRRRLYDPAFERSRVLWAAPGPEARSLLDERAAIERAGWRLIISDDLPGTDDADLLIGIPPGLKPNCAVPLARVPAGLFLLGSDPGHVLAEVDEGDKARRAAAVLERLLTSTRPRVADRGEGTFLVPQCWMVVGLTRDDDRPEGDRMPAMTFGQSFQQALGTRLRRFLHEVMSRAGIDVFYIEDAVTPQQFSGVLERLFEHHVSRAQPADVAERDFLGLHGLHVVLHEVDPETEGIKGVDSHLTRNAISRARILIVGKDRGGGGDDDGPPPIEGQTNDDWLREAIGRLFPRLQPIR
jgi:hypothetical protein